MYFKNNPFKKRNEEELKRDFLTCQTKEELADILEISTGKLFHILNLPTAKKYHFFSIPKKNGDTREIISPYEPLKYLQRKLNYILRLCIEPKKTSHGFEKGKSIVTNARVHAKMRLVLNLDLKDFFHTITQIRVERLFIKSFPFKSGISVEVAHILARICCHNVHLPQGAPTSPTISNLICRKMDSQLKELARNHNSRYSRYADDITFSTYKRSFSDNVLELSDENMKIGYELRSIIDTNGFEINDSKTRLQRKNKRQSVTGVVVNKKVNIPRKFIRNIRLMLHFLEKHGPNNAEVFFQNKYQTNKSLREVLKGKINFIGMIRGKDGPDADIFKKFLKKYHEIYGIPIPMGLKTIKEIMDENLFIVEVNNEKIGTVFPTRYGWVTCYHVLEDESSNKLFDKSKIKVYKPGNAEDPLSVSILKECKNSDLVILNIPDAENEPLEIDIHTPEKLDSVYFYGFPNYSRSVKDPSVTVCNISRINTLHGVKQYHLDGNIYSGYSGGPVLNQKGRVIGYCVHGFDENCSAIHGHVAHAIHHLVSLAN